MLGYVSFIVELIPRAVLAPILVFVAFDIIMQSFHAVPKQHAPAVAFAFFPTIARLLAIKLGTPEPIATEKFNELLVAPGKSLPELQVIIALGNGFIVTGMLWAAFLAELVDRRLKISAAYLVILALFSYFGIIHSAIPDGSMYLPWKLSGVVQQVPYQFALAYISLAAIFFALSFTRESKEPMSGLMH
jgi:AGZA family xanthine/uracil permease-like MFS transporter